MPAMDNHIALLCTLHPASTSKRDRCLSLLRRTAREYYCLPSSQCTIWSYFTPAAKTDTSLTLAGLEIYTDKAALQAQLDDKEHFQAYHETVKKEQLYSKPEELVAWYLAAGFVARSNKTENGGTGVLVSVSRLVGKSEGEARNVLEHVKAFEKWVHREERDGVLTYAIFTRPKAKSEVLIFVRYKDGKALRAHDEAPEHRKLSKAMAPLLDAKKTSTTVWREVEDSFVSAMPMPAGFGTSKL